MQKASVLIVGDDRQLLLTRAASLSDCAVMTTGSRDAEEAIRAAAFDLLIIGENVPDALAKMLLALAGRLYPQLKVLVASRSNSTRISILGLQRSIPLPQSIRANCRPPSRRCWRVTKANHRRSHVLGRWFRAACV